MPGILKVGMTDRTPEVRLSEANSPDTWRPPTPYKIELAKKVFNAAQKEKTLHILLDQYTNRISPRREFFYVSLEEVSKFFNLMDGEMWVETLKEEDEDEEEDNTYSYSAKQVNTTCVKGCRDMTKCFIHGQSIRHRIGINNTWIGTYDSYNNVVIYNEKTHTLHKFVESHYKLDRPERVSNANAWKECECEVNEKWISTFSLPY